MAEVNLKLLYGNLNYRSEGGVCNVRIKSSCSHFYFSWNYLKNSRRLQNVDNDPLSLRTECAWYLASCLQTS